MFRAPCMSQRRLALIFCVSILIVLLVALILLCEWGPSWASLGLTGGTPERGWEVSRVWGDLGREVPQGSPGIAGEQAETLSLFLGVPDIWWTLGKQSCCLCSLRSRGGSHCAFLPLGLLWWVGHPQQHPGSPSLGCRLSRQCSP